ncbi:MAG: hypothetical protein ACREBS_11800, partial [Nitrososphaerales archaeon]
MYAENNGENTRPEPLNETKLLADFVRWCRVDKQLAIRTVYKHQLNVKRFLATSKTFDKESCRAYLEKFLGQVQYQDQLKALRRLAQFLEKENEVKGFEFPQIPLKPG